MSAEPPVQITLWQLNIRAAAVHMQGKQTFETFRDGYNLAASATFVRDPSQHAGLFLDPTEREYIDKTGKQRDEFLQSFPGGRQAVDVQLEKMLIETHGRLPDSDCIMMYKSSWHQFLRELGNPLFLRAKTEIGVNNYLIYRMVQIRKKGPLVDDDEGRSESIKGKVTASVAAIIKSAGGFDGLKAKYESHWASLKAWFAGFEHLPSQDTVFACEYDWVRFLSILPGGHLALSDVDVNNLIIRCLIANRKKQRGKKESTTRGLGPVGQLSTSLLVDVLLMRILEVLGRDLYPTKTTKQLRLSLFDPDLVILLKHAEQVVKDEQTPSNKVPITLGLLNELAAAACLTSRRELCLWRATQERYRKLMHLQYAL